MSRHYRFGEWTVLPEHNQVHRNGEVHHLERRTMEVLVCLLKRSGEVVPLRLILDEVWGDRVVEENSVHQRIHQIRKVLGDSPRSSRYVANVPRRGYRLMAEVTPMEAGAPALLPAAAAALPEPFAPPEGAADDAAVGAGNRLRALLVDFNRYILVGTGWRAYPVLCLIGAVPILIAPFLGIWPDRAVPADAPLWAVCTPAPDFVGTVGEGFSSRWNWLIYPALLPLWLAAQRMLFRLSYGISPDSPLRRQARYAPFRVHLHAVLDDWRPIAAVIAVNVLLTIVDQADVVMRFIDVSTTCPYRSTDWGMFNHYFPDVSHWGVGLVTAWTTLEQMIFVHMTLITAVHVYLFNSRYMKSIYLRNDPRRQTTSYVLDLEDADYRFGLRPLSRIFDLQLLFCVLGGGVLLTERYFNTDQALVEEVATAATCSVGLFPQRCLPPDPPTFSELGRLVQDTAQLVVVTGWLAFLTTILYIANVKLLPRRVLGETSGRVAYLRELVVPNSAHDHLLESSDPADVDRVVNFFRHQNFWPIGDQRAADALSLCVLIFLLMLLPLTPTTAPQAVVFLVFVLASVVLARALLGLQKHLLARVDASLTRDHS